MYMYFKTPYYTRYMHIILSANFFKRRNLGCELEQWQKPKAPERDWTVQKECPLGGGRGRAVSSAWRWNQGGPSTTSKGSVGFLQSYVYILYTLLHFSEHISVCMYYIYSCTFQLRIAWNSIFLFSFGNYSGPSHLET